MRNQAFRSNKRTVDFYHRLAFLSVASFQPNIGGLTFHTHHTQLLLVIVMCDRQLCKTPISSERTLQTVTIAVMLVDCTKLVYPICQLSSNVTWLKQK